MGEFKTERISFSSLKGENKTGLIQSSIQYYLHNDPNFRHYDPEISVK